METARKMQEKYEMNKLMNTTNQTPIEIALGVDKDGMTTARKLYEFLELNQSNYSKWLKRNITENEFAIKGEDFHSYQITSEGRGNFADDYKLTADFAKKLSMTAKNEKGEEARSYFVSIENKAKESAIGMQDLSPDLRLMIQIELNQKKQQKQLDSVETQIQGIRNVVAIDTRAWRDDTEKVMRKIGNICGDHEAFREVHSEAYKLLESRGACSLKQRLTNKRRRMADEGICKSKRDKLNYLDIIAEDKKLVEIYTAIVKELAIKYGVA
ncbi:MAG: antA/AntB antirepressor family protein [Clostridium sp.]|uniref:antA/AntB antirepressor family protein n=1 Tax=Clostridium innocuum TaxID=1522 RepID=UPI001EDE8D8A|nr:antA/AntB antirepressor family protein [[Clostridium] innocuum]MCG4663514.1 antA/AntB antirepressor family protein [[Clostridium] innocuum]